MVGDAAHHRMRARHGLAPTFVCARRETQQHRDDRRRTRHVPRPSLRANAVLVRARRASPLHLSQSRVGARQASPATKHADTAGCRRSASEIPSVGAPHAEPAAVDPDTAGLRVAHARPLHGPIQTVHPDTLDRWRSAYEQHDSTSSTASAEAGATPGDDLSKPIGTDIDGVGVVDRGRGMASPLQGRGTCGHYNDGNACEC